MAKPIKAPSVAGQRLLKRLGDDDILDQVDDSEDELDTASSLVQVVCLYEGPVVKFNIAGRKYRMRFGDVERLEMAYAAPIQMRPGTDPQPAVIEMLTNRKVLPVLDPRVDKNADGVPIAALEAQTRKAAQAKTAAAQTKAQPGA
jgi:hypothetical protein